jgi:hypothetical protein
MRYGGVTLAVEQNRLFGLAPDAGFLRFFSVEEGDFPFVYHGPVEGKADWLVLNNGHVNYPLEDGGSDQFGLPATFTSVFQKVYGRYLPWGEGVVVVTQEGALYTADLGANPLTLALRLKSQVDSIDSLALETPLDGGVAEGYAVMGPRLMRVWATTLARWNSQEVALGDAVPRAVWADGAKMRVALEDGQVLSLPGRVPLSEPIEPRPVAYAPACRGSGFALTSEGLWVLAPDGWRYVEGPQLPRGSSYDDGLSRARLFTVGQELFISTGYGAVVRHPFFCDGGTP